jgi:thiol:disulfide interchange protein DsbD
MGITPDCASMALILGPPTYLFLDHTHQEVRGLRLTGAFTEAELLGQLQDFEALETP